MHRLLENQDTKTGVQELIKNKEVAENFLSEFGQNAEDKAVGPFRLDDTTKILTPKTWEKVAGKYASAFKNGNKAFPYFTTS